MNLLLDELFPPVIAEELRKRGHDVIAAQERTPLRGLPDEELFNVAQAQGRAICTENVADFLLLDGQWRARQEAHWGLVLTSNRSFPRGQDRTIGLLVRALDDLLRETTIPGGRPSSPVVWLQAPD